MLQLLLWPDCVKQDLYTKLTFCDKKCSCSPAQLKLSSHSTFQTQENQNQNKIKNIEMHKFWKDFHWRRQGPLYNSPKTVIKAMQLTSQQNCTKTFCGPMCTGSFRVWEPWCRSSGAFDNVISCGWPILDTQTLSHEEKEQQVDSKSVLVFFRQCKKEICPCFLPILLFHWNKLALFSLLTVANYKNYTCHHRRPVTSNDTTGYISTLPLDDAGGGHGSSRCPLVIQGQPGQKVNITSYS